MPKSKIDDPRLLTDLPSAPYIEACKAYGAERERWNVSDPVSIETACWEATLAALRVYEFERAKIDSPQRGGNQ